MPVDQSSGEFLAGSLRGRRFRSLYTPDLLPDYQEGGTTPIVESGWHRLCYSSVCFVVLSLQLSSCYSLYFIPRIQSNLLEGFIFCIYWGECSEPLLAKSMPILFVCMYIICIYIMSSTACVPAQRANVAGLASSARPTLLCILLVRFGKQDWEGYSYMYC